MRYATMRGTGWDISTVGLGTWPFSGDDTWGAQEESVSVNTIRAALDAGINFFDTALLYGKGRSEVILGKALGSDRDKAYVASKAPSTAFRRDALRSACEDSLRHLNMDWIDLYQLHWPHPTIPLAETLDALDALKAEGKIRAYGVSNFGAKDLAPGLKPKRFAIQTNQLPYNLVFRAIEHEILPFCIREKIDVICYSSLMMGLLAGKYTSPDAVPEGRARTRHFSGDRPKSRHGEAGAEEETFDALRAIRKISDEIGEPMNHVAIAWLRSQPGVLCAFAGARTPYQVRGLARAGNLALSPGDVARLTEATNPLKKRLGTNPDPYQSNSRIH